MRTLHPALFVRPVVAALQAQTSLTVYIVAALRRIA